MTAQRVSISAFLWTLLACSGCSGDVEAQASSSSEPEAQPALLPAELPTPPGREEIPDPRPRVRTLHGAEELAAALTDQLYGLAEKLAVRDQKALPAALSEDFRGHDWFGARESGRKELLLGTIRREYDPGSAAVLNAEEFCSAVGKQMRDWRRVREVTIEVLSAEFLAGEPTWGKAHLNIALGWQDRSGLHSLRSKAQARIELSGKRWRISRLWLDSLTTLDQERELFVDVTRSCGLEYKGIPYGDPGNDDDQWNGACSGDVNRDGLFDLFVPSSVRNFLYVNRGDGAFAEEAEQRGVLGEGRGTGTVLFDFDNDGDQDLFVAHVGWMKLDGTKDGRSLEVYENDGRGSFREVSERVGLDVHMAAFSLTALDYDGDGFVDLFASGFGIIDREPNNSWIQATNGESDRLFRNLGGKRFEDVTDQAGVRDRSWTYASAAADFDADGDLDLYLVNNFGPNRLLRNRGDGSFEDAAGRLGVDDGSNGMAASYGDWNNDGLLDLFVSNHYSSVGQRVLERMRQDSGQTFAKGLLELPEGNGVFVFRQGKFDSVGPSSGATDASFAWSNAVGDLNLDGCLDVVCVNGFVTGDLPHDT
jgi:hypothetical protein